MKKLSFRPGQFVFKSGEKSTEIFLLVEGEDTLIISFNITGICFFSSDVWGNFI